MTIAEIDDLLRQEAATTAKMDFANEIYNEAKRFETIEEFRRWILTTKFDALKVEFETTEEKLAKALKERKEVHND